MGITVSGQSVLECVIKPIYKNTVFLVQFL